MGSVERTLKCPICQDLFTDPAMLPCGHNFCLTCIRAVWNADVSKEGPFFCPECQILLPSDLTLEVNSSLQAEVRDFTTRTSAAAAGPGATHAVSAGTASASTITCDHCIEAVAVAIRTCLTCDASLCQAHARLHQQRAALRDHTVVEVTEDPLSLKCKEHREELKLFCVEDQVPVCSLCVLVGSHKNHQAVQLQDACSDLKKTLETNMTQLLQRRSVAELAIKDLESLYTEAMKSAAAFRDRISEKYSKLRVMIEEDEGLMMKIVDSEEKHMAEWLESQRERLEGHLKQIDHLRGTSKSLTQETNDLKFLQQITAQRLGKPLDLPAIREVERELCAPEKMRTVETLVDDLSLALSQPFPRLWSYLRTLTLDPGTAHPHLEVSQDSLQVCWSRQPTGGGSSSERFDSQYSILALESFTTGRHYWEVLVQEKPYWMIGATSRPIGYRGASQTQMQGLTNLDMNKASWCVYHGDGQYLACHDTQETLLSVGGRRVRKLGMLVDLQKGELLFYDADTLALLHSFTVPCQEPLYPMFNPCINVNDLNRQPLTLFCLRDCPDRSVSAGGGASGPSQTES